VKELYSSTIHGLAAISVWILVYMVVGVVCTAGVSFLYVNSPNYCRDCNTGIGLCGIGFILSLGVTPAVIYFACRLFKAPDTSDKS